jgi:hypothetical protein
MKDLPRANQKREHWDEIICDRKAGLATRFGKEMTNRNAERIIVYSMILKTAVEWAPNWPST